MWSVPDLDLEKSRKVQTNKTFGHFSLEGQYLLMTPYIQVSPQEAIVNRPGHWSTSTPHFLVEFRMAVRMILSLLKLVRTFILYSNYNCGTPRYAKLLIRIRSALWHPNMTVVCRGPCFGRQSTVGLTRFTRHVVAHLKLTYMVIWECSVDILLTYRLSTTPLTIKKCDIS